MVQAPGLHGPPVVTQDIDINTDPSCGRIMDPDMAIRCRLDWMSPWTRVAPYASQMSMGPATTGFLDSSMAPGIGRDPEQLYGLGWQQKPQTSTQTLAAVGPWTQACSWDRTQAGSHGPRWQRRTSGFSRPRIAVWSSGTNMASGCWPRPWASVMPLVVA